MQDKNVSTDDMKEIVAKTWDARSKWYFIGFRFNLKASELDVIDKNNKEVDEKFMKMIEFWLHNGTGCTWRAVYEALKHTIVNRNDIAEELKKGFAKQANKGLLTCMHNKIIIAN